MKFDEDFYEKLIENLYDGVYFVDTERVITYWNKGSERITGYKSQQVVGRPCSDNILNHCTENGLQLCKNGCPLSATLRDGNAREAEVFLHHADGHRVPVRIRVSPIHDEKGVVTGAVETFSNNAESFKVRRKIHRLEEIATSDSLTGVGNRRFGEMRLKTAFLEYQVTHVPFGLLFIDLDDFKMVNDTRGHEVGDRLLQVTANTLRTNLRENDAVVRWGGEEFVVLIYNTDEDALTRIAEKMRNLIEQSNILREGQVLNVTASIGATLVRGGDLGNSRGDTPETLIARADRLMYVSKNAGKNRVTFG